MPIDLESRGRALENEYFRQVLTRLGEDLRDAPRPSRHLLRLRHKGPSGSSAKAAQSCENLKGVERQDCQKRLDTQRYNDQRSSQSSSSQSSSSQGSSTQGKDSGQYGSRTQSSDAQTTHPGMSSSNG